MGEIRLPINTILDNFDSSRNKLQSLRTTIIEIQCLEDENVRLAMILLHGRNAFVRICNRMDVLLALVKADGPIAEFFEGGVDDRVPPDDQAPNFDPPTPNEENDAKEGEAMGADTPESSAGAPN